MALDHNQAKENSFYFLKILFVLFILTYLIWYFGGGPEKWDRKFKEMELQKEPSIFTKGVIKIDN